MTVTQDIDGYLRLSQIIGRAAVTQDEADWNKRQAKAETKKGKKRINTKPKRPRKAIPAIIPVGHSTWWAGVKTGRFPQPVRALGGRIAVWSRASILALANQSAPIGERP